MTSPLERIHFSQRAENLFVKTPQQTKLLQLYLPCLNYKVKY
jgi:hypothetical protein